MTNYFELLFITVFSTNIDKNIFFIDDNLCKIEITIF